MKTTQSAPYASRLTPEDRAKIELIAKKRSVSPAQAIRLVMREKSKKQIAIRLKSDDLALLDYICKQQNINRSEAVRRAITTQANQEKGFDFISTAAEIFGIKKGSGE